MDYDINASEIHSEYYADDNSYYIYGCGFDFEAHFQKRTLPDPLNNSDKEVWYLMGVAKRTIGNFQADVYGFPVDSPKKFTRDYVATKFHNMLKQDCEMDVTQVLLADIGKTKQPA